MKKPEENKAITPENTKVENKQRFFYPDHQVTIEAATKEEADRQLDKITKTE